MILGLTMFSIALLLIPLAQGATLVAAPRPVPNRCLLLSDGLLASTNVGRGL
jgi:hypothetical protein